MIEDIYHQCIDLGVLPFLLLFPASEARAFRHRPGFAAAAHLASFLILRPLLEAAMSHVPVHLGAAQLTPPSPTMS